MSSKVKLVVGKGINQETFLVAPALLAFHSPVFEAMFFGPNADGSDVVEFPEDDPSAFSTLVRYGEHLEFKGLHINKVVEVYHLFEKYLMLAAKSKCIDHLIECIDSRNVVEILQNAEELEEDHLSYRCWLYILENTKEVLLGGLRLANRKTVSAIVRQSIMSHTVNFVDAHGNAHRASGDFKEVDVYNGIVSWGKRELCWRKEEFSHLREVVQSLISEIRFLTMSVKEFAENVCGNGVLTNREELEVLKAIDNCVPTESPRLNKSTEERKAFSSEVCRLTNCRFTRRTSLRFPREETFLRVTRKIEVETTVLDFRERFRAKSHNLYVCGLLVDAWEIKENDGTLRIRNVTREKEVETTVLAERKSGGHWEVLSKSSIFVAKGEIFEVRLQSEANMFQCCALPCTNDVNPMLERIFDSSLAQNPILHSRGIVALPLDE